MDKVGIIDLGSNTFHLLIVSVHSDKTFDVLHKERYFVGLAENGIESLSDAAMERGLETLAKFKNQLRLHEVTNYKVTGTAALRSANNRDVFINKVKKELQFEIEVIDGQREAELIFKGVSLLKPLRGNHLIMDIGGGSVEFILIENELNVWSKSYNLGVGVLYNQFHKSDPISKKEISQLIAFLYETLQDFRERVKGMSMDTLIGASGSFEVVESMNGNEISTKRLAPVSLDDYWNVSARIIDSTLKERTEMKGLPNSRVKLIVVAMILIDVVIEIINPQKILISPYALKEGMLSELID